MPHRCSHEAETTLDHTDQAPPARRDTTATSVVGRIAQGTAAGFARAAADWLLRQLDEDLH